jgi:spermidine synthase
MTDLSLREDAATAATLRSRVVEVPDDEHLDAPVAQEKSAEERWLDESVDEPAGQRLRADRTVFLGASAHQDIWIFENPAFGRVLALDGYVQTTVRDEFIYHEMMAHVPLMALGGARDVLIVGGGDGGVLREVLKHASVRRAVLVEIDRRVIELSRAHLPSLGAGAFSDPRAEIVVDDGAAFLRRTTDAFDAILIDAPDPVGPGRALFRSEFLAACRSRLRPGGILVAQCGVSFLQTAQIRRTVSRLGELFQGVTAYTVSVPTYYGGAMTFACATDAPQKLAVSEETIAMRFAASRIRTRCYTPALHVAAFALPRYLAELLWRGGR